MTEMIKVVILAIVQGITEFLPISSSGHLVLAGHFLNVNTDDATLEVFLHFGTLLALLVFFRKRLVALSLNAVKGDKPTWNYLTMIGIAVIPAVLAYLAFKEKIEATFKNPQFVAPLLCVTGIILLLPKFFKPKTESAVVPDGKRITPLQSIAVGISQAIALLPGISRSGTTITTARLTGVQPDAAAEFSFFIGIPLMAGATLLKAFKLYKTAEYTISPLSMFVGVIVSAIIGYVSLVIVINLLRKGKFWLFGIYCLAIGLCATAYLYLFN